MHHGAITIVVPLALVSFLVGADGNSSSSSSRSSSKSRHSSRAPAAAAAAAADTHTTGLRPPHDGRPTMAPADSRRQQTPSSLGPGRGPWQRGPPEEHGLSAAALSAAAQRIADTAPTRDCLLVVKNGILVHESYATGTESTQYETDSLGKVFTAAVVGAAVQLGALDVDKPLVEYGLTSPTVPGAWNRSGVDYWPNVTARHLLNQMSGYGLAPPGSLFSYDSDIYIQELSAVLRVTAGRIYNGSAVAFAQHAFAEPLGVPRLYEFDGLGDDISAGGGQMATCREIARAGQLLLNHGKWLDENGQARQLMDESYTRQLFEPAQNGVVEGYGFLVWLNTK